MRNSAGKTTTLRMLLGLVRPTFGSGTILGDSITQPATYLPEQSRGSDRVASVLPAAGRPGEPQALARLGQLPLSAVDPVLERSGLPARAGTSTVRTRWGTKQRLGIAAAILAADPGRADERPRPRGHRHRRLRLAGRRREHHRARRAEHRAVAARNRLHPQRRDRIAAGLPRSAPTVRRAPGRDDGIRRPRRQDIGEQPELVKISELTVVLA
jgi:hypothetical protein